LWRDAKPSDLIAAELDRPMRGGAALSRLHALAAFALLGFFAREVLQKE
jgi:hypothetical protein